MYSGHCPVRGNYEIAPEGQFPIPAETVTIGEVAKGADYATATFGKWGMGFFDTSGSPQKQGIDLDHAKLLITINGCRNLLSAGGL